MISKQWEINIIMGYLGKIDIEEEGFLGVGDLNTVTFLGIHIVDVNLLNSFSYGFHFFFPGNIYT